MGSIDDKGNLHDRAGKFSEKKHSAPSSGLTPAHEDTPRTPLRVQHADGRDGYTAVVDAPTGRVYVKDGVLSRTNGPAYEGHDGTQEWRVDGILNRSGGAPAVIHDDGSTEHWENGHPVRL